MKPVAIADATIDGLQSMGTGLSAEDKLALARALASARVNLINVGRPSRGIADYTAAAAVSQLVPNATIAAVARARHEEIVCAAEAIKAAASKRLIIAMPVSAAFLRDRLRLAPDSALTMLHESLTLARQLCQEVEFLAEDASRADWGFLDQAVGLAGAAGARVVTLQDSTGHLAPKECYDLVRHVRGAMPGLTETHIGMDCRHDLGMALANALSAVEHGVEQVWCTVGGIGYPLGRVPLETFLSAIRSREERYRLHSSVKSSELHRLSGLVHKFTARRLEMQAHAAAKVAASLSADRAPFPTETTALCEGADRPFQLQSFKLVTGDDDVCRACVEVHDTDTDRTRAGSAASDNQVDALHRALQEALGFNCQVVEHAVNHRGPSAKEVIICLDHRGRISTGFGTGSSVLRASALAYLTAVNNSLVNQR